MSPGSRAQRTVAGQPPHLPPGQTIICARDSSSNWPRGFAEITFDSGAQVVLEGPASLDLNSAWDATLRRGTLKANVPTEAMGFRISNPSVEVVDLGTVFTMIADRSGAADVLVLKGMVETSSRDSAGPADHSSSTKISRVTLRRSGVSKVSDPEQKFARVAQPVAARPLCAVDQIRALVLR